MIAVNTIAWFIVTLLMMGFFAGVEMAFYSVNRFGIELRKKQGRSDAILLSKYFENPELFLSTMLIGFTLFLVCFALLFTNCICMCVRGSHTCMPFLNGVCVYVCGILYANAAKSTFCIFMYSIGNI